MSLVHRLVLSAFLRYFGYTMAGAVILFSLVDLFDHLGSFIDNDATLAMVGRYYLYKGAWIVDTCLPIALLMATLFTIGSMARYLELTALFAAGLSLMRVSRPLLWTAAVMVLVSLAWREYVLPRGNRASERIWEVEIHGRPDKVRTTKNIAVVGSDDRFYLARRFNPTENIVTDLKVVSKRDSQVVERIDAASARWDGRHWILSNGTRRIFVDGREQTFPFEELTASDLALTPEGLYRERIKQEDMNLSQLFTHRQLVSETGGDPTAVQVDIQFQIAFPLVNLIVVLLGILLASGPRKTTIASGFGLTIGISFIYYLFMNFGRSLGHAGVLPPLVAGWAGNVTYGLAGWILYLRARR